MKKAFIIIPSIIVILALLSLLVIVGYTYGKSNPYNISTPLNSLTTQAKAIVAAKDVIGSWVGDYIISDKDDIYSFEKLGFQSSLVFDEDGTVKYSLLQDGIGGTESGKWTMQDENTILLKLEDSRTMKVIFKNDKLSVSYQPHSDKIKTMVFKKGELRKPQAKKEPKQKEVSLQDYMNFINSYSNPMDYYHYYDVDGNGVKDIIIHTGTCEADYKYEVYTMKNSQVTKMGTFGWGHSSVFGNSSGKGLIMDYGQMGYEEIYEVTYKNGAFNENLIYEGEFGPEEAGSTPQNAISLQYYYR